MLPEEDERNGMITGHMVACTDEGGSMSRTLITSNLTTTIGGLNPYSFYMCSVSASTGAGDSPAATLNFTTATDSKWRMYIAGFMTQESY